MKKLSFSLLTVFLLGVVTPAEAQRVLDFGVNYTLISNYTASGTSGSAADRASGIWLGDLRGAGLWRDLVVANKADNTLSVRTCYDDATFSPLTVYNVGTGPVGVRSGKLNGDKYEDVVVANNGSGNVSVLYNLGYGGQLGAAVNYTVGAGPSPGPVAVAIGDVNSDGANDIVVANETENSISILQYAAGIYVLSSNYTVGAGPQSVQLVDLNQDGWNDILTANTNGTLTVLRRMAGNVFSNAQTVSLPDDPKPVCALGGDFDKDGFVDIAVANHAANTISILTGSSEGNFVLSTNIPVGSNPKSLLLRDLNADGYLDIGVANEGSGNIHILLYDPVAGVFVSAATNVVGSNPGTIVGSNFNGDGVNDLAVANNGDNTISILIYDAPIAYSSTVTAYEDAIKAFSISGKVYSGRTLTYLTNALPTNGTLSGTAPNYTYLPDADFFGADSFQFSVTDGTTTSAVATVTFNVLPVNDPPSFSVSTSEITLTNYGIVNYYPGFIAGTSMGPANEVDQKYSFVVTVTNAAFFSSKPAINTNGVLSFKVSTSAVGTNTVSVQIKDTGGTLYGGVNISTPPIGVKIIVPTNPYPAVAGIYNGLFFETNGVAHESSGFITLKMAALGNFSGKVISGRSYGFSGRFNSEQQAAITISRGTNNTPLYANLLIDPVSKQISGTITNDSWSAVALADLMPVHSPYDPSPLAGRYTLILPGNAATGPGGDGYGLVTVDDYGKLRVTGYLADGRSFSQVTYPSPNGEWPFYVAAYAGKGSLLSWLSFTNQPSSSIVGDVSWIKTSEAGWTYYQYYQLGFTNSFVASGSTLTNIGLGLRALDITNCLTRLAGGNLVSALVNNVVLSSNNLFTVTGGQADRLTLAVTTNGIISGKFVHPVSGKSTAVRGIILQQQKTAGGYFLGPSESGSFLLQEQ